MLALFTADEDQLPRIRSTLPPGEELIATADWHHFQRTLADARCAIVLVPWLDRAPALDRLRLLKTRYPLKPVVLITSRDVENARLLKDFVVEEVVWLSEMTTELPGAIAGAAGNELLLRLARTFEGAEHLPAILRAALAHACRSAHPVRSLEQLAASVGRDRRTLWHHWKSSGLAAAVGIKTVLDWIVLLRAANLKIAGRSWSAVAAMLEIDAQTLGILAKRVAGTTLRDLAFQGRAGLVTRFRAEVLAPLLGTGALDVSY